jgi:iron complex outermembrane receptor protein
MKFSARVRCSALIAALALGLASPSIGQELEAWEEEEVAAEDKVEHSGIEEILVTAEKRSAVLQETPMAISVLTAADLLATGTEDVSGLAFQVPNLHYGEAGGLSRITIRGISNTGFTDPSATFHIDGVYQYNPTAASSLVFYDIAQVEVLRGPQGTLYGRSSTAGSINITSNPPVHEFEAYGDMMLGSYEQIFTRAVVNIPLIDERVALRTAVFQDSRNGYQKNLFNPYNDADDAQEWGLRNQVLFSITPDVDLTMRGGYAHQGGVGWGSKVQINPVYPANGYPGPYHLIYDDPSNNPFPPFCFGTTCEAVVVDPYRDAAPNSTDPREARHDADNYEDVDTWDVNGTLVWDLYNLPLLGDATFNVVASYKQESRTQRNDGDFTEIPMVVANTQAGTTDIVIDSHLISADDEDFEWLLGFFFLDATGHLEIDLSPLDLPNASVFGGLVNPGSIRIIDAGILGSQEKRTVAGYGHGKMNFLEDTFSLGLGVRYSYDWATDRLKVNEARNVTLGVIAGETDPYPCAAPGFDHTGSDTWGAVSGDLKAELRPMDDHMIYVSIARGYKPGVVGHRAILTCDAIGVVLPDGSTSDGTVVVPNAEPEQNWAWEIGFKNTFFENRLQANLTGFHYRYENLQVTGRQDNSTVTQNAPLARVSGVEIETIWMPTDELQLGLLYGYLHARFSEYSGIDFELVGTVDPVTGVVSDGRVDFSGNHMLRAPDHSATIFAQYTHDMGSNGRLIPRIQYYISDEVYFAAANRDSDRQPSYGKLELRLRWEDVDDRMYIEAFGENLTDENVMTTKTISSSLLGRDPRTTTANYDEPLTWGFRLGLRW